MAIYTVHAPPGGAPPEATPLRLLFVKEGFCWPALFFAPLWLLFRRLWLTFLAYCLILALIGAVGRAYGAEAIGPVAMLFGLWFALEANQLRRWTMERWGWRLVGLAVGRDRLEAEAQYFAQLAAGTAVAPPPAAPPAPASLAQALGG
ncbi:MAG: DUF2628 domain-containing protein [Bauldia sp.]